MADTFQNEVPRARINLKLSLHTGGAQKKLELPLKLLTIGDFSHGKENRPLSEREKINVNKQKGHVGFRLFCQGQIVVEGFIEMTDVIKTCQKVDF